MSAHTPGPWTSDDEVIPWGNGANCGVRVAFPSDVGVTSPICIVDPRWGGFTAKANARLIAASPELLEALEKARSYSSEAWSTWLKVEVDAAIAKARGES